jgi:SAM-dependent methyltransferase
MICLNSRLKSCCFPGSGKEHDISGKILDIGVGTGKNMPFYPAGSIVTAIDFSGGMLEKAVKRIRKLGLSNVELIKMDDQNLEFGNETFDSIISAFVFCTVPVTVPMMGTYMNRKTQKNIENAGFRIERAEKHLIDVVRLMKTGK